MDNSFKTSAPIGIWWQLRTFELHERISDRWWNEQADRRPKGIALLQYTLRGLMIYHDAKGETHPVPPGWAMLSSSGDPAAYGSPPNPTEPYECFWISFSGAGLAEHWEDIRERFGSIVDLGGHSPVIERARAICRMKRPSNIVENAAMSAEIHAFVRYLYTFLEGASRRGCSAIDLAVREMENCTDGRLTLKEVAARYHISREHLTRVFTQKKGVPPAQYMARVKLQRATSLLAETRLPIGDVAKQCGFGTKQSLIRWMRREMKCLPSEFRREQGA